MTRDDKVGVTKKIAFNQRFLMPNCQFLTNINFENSFVIRILLAKDNKKLIFEH